MVVCQKSQYSCTSLLVLNWFWEAQVSNGEYPDKVFVSKCFEYKFHNSQSSRVPGFDCTFRVGSLLSGRSLLSQQSSQKPIGWSWNGTTNPCPSAFACTVPHLHAPYPMWDTALLPTPPRLIWVLSPPQGPGEASPSPGSLPWEPSPLWGDNHCGEGQRKTQEEGMGLGMRGCVDGNECQQGGGWAQLKKGEWEVGLGDSLLLTAGVSLVVWGLQTAPSGLGALASEWLWPSHLARAGGHSPA